MKLYLNKLTIIVLGITGLFSLTACPETDTNKPREEEQRYFDLYMQSRYPDLSPTSTGLYYLENKEGEGPELKEGDWMLIRYVGYKIPGDVVFDTYIQHVAQEHGLYRPDVLYGPFKTQQGNSVEGLTEGLSTMREGGQATLFFTSDLGYGAEGKGNVGSYQSLKYEVDLLKIIGNIETYEQERFHDYVDTIARTDTIHDPATDAVLYYVIDQQGDGDTLVNGLKVDVAYTGYLIDGREFASYDTLNYTLGSNEAIDGFNLALLKYRVGGKGKLVIPYPLAYGETGKQNNYGQYSVPPYETLIYDIEVVDAKESSSSN